MKSLISTLLFAIILMIGTLSPITANQGVGKPDRSRKSPSSKSDKTIRGQLGHKIDDYLKRTVPFGFSGAILVAKNGEIILENGYGLADRARRVPITPDTIFYVGSLTKQFTAAAILKLEMQGKLRVTDTLSQHFKDVPPDKAGITIHQLLSHSAGFPPSTDTYGIPVLKDEQLRLIMGMELKSAPGTEYLYSNPGYNLLGMIVENVSGEPYEQYLFENLFKPAGMLTTGYRNPKWDKDRFAHGYSGDVDRGSPLDRVYWLADGPSWKLRGAGVMHSTLADIYRWHLALEKDEILSGAAKSKSILPHIRIEGDEFYGYGWLINKTTPGKTLIQHAGSDGIFFADIRRYIDENVVIIGFTNDASNSGVINGKVPNIIFGGNPVKLPPLVKAKTIAPAILQKYPGVYRLPSGATINVTLKNNRLILDPIGQEAVNLMGNVQPSEKEKFDRLTAQIKAIFDEAVKGDFARLKASVTPEKFESFKVFITDNLQLSGGDRNSKNVASAAYEVLGTHLLWFTGEKLLGTLVRVNNGKEAPRLLLMVWTNDFLGASLALPESDAVSFRSSLIARSPSRFVGFHNGLEKTVSIKFKMNRKGEAAAIEFLIMKGIVTAKRVSTY